MEGLRCAVGDSWLTVLGWRLVSVRLAVGVGSVGGWCRLAVGGWCRLAVGGWCRLAVKGWRLTIGGLGVQLPGDFCVF